MLKLGRTLNFSLTRAPWGGVGMITGPICAFQQYLGLRGTIIGHQVYDWRWRSPEGIDEEMPQRTHKRDKTH